MSDFGLTNDATRESWITERLLELKKGLKILDAGAGDQHHRQICKHLEYYSQDFGQYDGKGNNAGLQTSAYNYGKLDIVSDILAIPVPDESYDAVLCTEVLEHIPYPDLAIKELSRLLKKDGKLILTAPFCSLTHFAPYHYATGFNQYWYTTVLPKYNLKVTSLGAYGNFFEYLAQELNRLPTVIFKYCGNMYMSEDEKIDTLRVIKMLEKYGKPTNSSTELLNFGMLVTAEKE